MGEFGEDFTDYMDTLAAREEAERERQAMYDRHEVWCFVASIGKRCFLDPRCLFRILLHNTCLFVFFKKIFLLLSISDL